jgi:hypothetical protein
LQNRGNGYLKTFKILETLKVWAMFRLPLKHCLCNLLRVVRNAVGVNMKAGNIIADKIARLADHIDNFISE